jgi:aspartate-semialdehyde dehydrogenase
MDEDVPLLIPEINTDHLGLIEIQQKKRGFGKVSSLPIPIVPWRVLLHRLRHCIENLELNRPS